MTNEDFVKSIYPDAKVEKMFLFNQWILCIHTYECGELRHCGIKVDPIPKDENEAWEQAAQYIRDQMMRKLLT
jgi:hypothetical protein